MLLYKIYYVGLKIKFEYKYENYHNGINYIWLNRSPNHGNTASLWVVFVMRRIATFKKSKGILFFSVQVSNYMHQILILLTQFSD